MARPRGIYKHIHGAVYTVLCVDTDTKVTCTEEIKLAQAGLSNKEVLKILNNYLPKCMRPVAVLSSVAFSEHLVMPEEIFLAFAQPVEIFKKERKKEHEQEI